MSHRWTVYGMILALCVGGIAANHEKASHDHHKRQHHVITLDSRELHPATVTMSPDDVLVWVNYSGKTVHLKLAKDQFDKWSCESRVNFGVISENQVLSPPIGHLEYSPPCRLPTGKYTYRVVGLSSPGMIDFDQDAPGDPVGTINVE